MKRAFTLCLVWILVAGSICFAAEYDLENMTTAELNELRGIVEEELSENHEPSSSQKSKIDDTVKGFIESYYGEDNVSWAWIDYSYTREWDFFTMETHADIKKQDGGKAEYDIYGEVVANGNSYQVVYVEVGTEVLLDERSTSIHDPRVLSMLGLKAEEPEARDTETMPDADSPDEKEPSAAEEEEAPVIVAKRGDRNETVKSVQEMLIRLGYLSGTADGDFGPGTEKAVKAFQKENGFTEDGIVTEEVYDAMNSAVAAMPEPVDYPHYTAAELYKKFEDNELAAEAELEDQVIQVTGPIEEISETIWGTPYVTLRADSYGFTTIKCYFDREQVSQLAELKSGKNITIQGTCGTLLVLEIEMKDCELIK